MDPRKACRAEHKLLSLNEQELPRATLASPFSPDSSPPVHSRKRVFVDGPQLELSG